MDKFDANGFLKSKGIEFQGIGEDGEPQFKFPDGTSGGLDVKGYLKSTGVPIQELDIEFNDPKSALESSPLSLGERVKTAFGDEKGKLAYLKNKFEGVTYDEEAGLVVKDKGVWRQVDPKNFNSPQELLKDMVDIIPEVIEIGSSLVAGGAGLAAGPLGAAAASTAAAGAAKGFNVLMGKLAGTYEDDATGIAQDVGFEMALNLGAELLPPAVKAGVKGGKGLAKAAVEGASPSLKKLAQSFSTIGQQASDGVKDILAATLKQTVGASETATRTMFENSDIVTKELDLARKGARSVADVQNKLKDESIEMVNTILEKAPGALSKKYMDITRDLVEDSWKIKNANISEITENALKSAEDSGLLTRTETGKFRVLTPEESAAKFFETGQSVNLTGESATRIQSVVDGLNGYLDGKTFSGKEAGMKLMQFKKNINEFIERAVDGANPAEKRLIFKLKEDVTNGIKTTFDSAGLGEKYLSTSNVYEVYGDAVKKARKLADSAEGAETLLKDFATVPGKNRTKNETAQVIASLLGQEGYDTMNRLAIKNAAFEYSSFLPRAGLLPSLATGGVATAVATGNIDPSTGLVAGALLSPRAVLRATAVPAKAVNFLRGLSRSERLALLKDDKTLSSLIKIIGSSEIDEAQMQSQIEQMGGLK